LATATESKERLLIMINRDLNTKVRIEHAKTRKSMSAIVEEALSEYFKTSASRKVS